MASSQPSGDLLGLLPQVRGWGLHHFIPWPEGLST